MFIKKVNFDLTKNTIGFTYSSDDYDRLCIDSVMYRKACNKLTNEELINIYIELDLYKLYEMPIHVDSLRNNTYIYKKHIRRHN